MSSLPVEAFIALGGNLGDVMGAFERALAGLEAGGAQVVGVSPAYETRPLVRPGCPPGTLTYRNAVCAVQTRLAPLALLTLCQQLEAAAGRVRAERWGDRTLDLDLLLMGSLVIMTPKLTLPHPELTRRLFVLRPLCDLAPDQPVPPGGRTVRTLLGEHADPEDGILGHQNLSFFSARRS